MLLLISLNIWFANGLASLSEVTHQYVISSQTGPSYNLEIAAPPYGGSVAFSSDYLGYQYPAFGTYAIFAGDKNYTTILLTAHPDKGFNFDYWKINGADASNSTKYDLTMYGNTEVEPVFSSQIFFNLSKPLYKELTDLANTIKYTANSANDGTFPDIDFMLLHLVGAQLGVFNIQDLSNFAASLMTRTSNSSLKAQEILYAYTLLMPYGIANKTAIQWALENQPMLSNGLPDTGTAVGQQSAFWLDDRYEINGYYWAQLYSYDLSKWNLTHAYNSFEMAVDSERDGCPATLCVNSTGQTCCWWGNGHPRYYDECAQTIDVFLRFYQLGITDALSKATNVWNYVNANDWVGDHYGYYVGDTSFECESSGFDQVALKLYYYEPNLQFVDRIVTDINTRFIQSGFNSIQWTPGQGALVVHDYALDGPSARLENTLLSWASIYGTFDSFDPADQTKIKNMIDGLDNPFNLTAWQYTLSTNGGRECSRLYNPFLNLFEWHETSSFDLFATSAAESLFIILGITPDTTSLAIPLVDNSYEDIGSVINPNLIHLNLNTSTLQIPVASTGELNFHYGSVETSHSFSGSGIYLIQFSPDWNEIVNVSKISELPTAYLYYPATPLSQSTPSSVPLGSNQQTISPNSTVTNSAASALPLQTVQYLTNNVGLWNITVLADLIILLSGMGSSMIIIVKKSSEETERS